MTWILFTLLIVGLTKNSFGTPEYWQRPEDGPLETDPMDYCMRLGITYDVGDTYEDTEKCKVCECCNSGDFKCKPKVCTNEQPPPCGENHYDTTDDPCCPTVDQECQNETCPPTTCAGPEVYAPDDCCPQCGCTFRGVDVLPGPITTSPTAACEQCICYTDGNVVCNKKAELPASDLQCVDAEVKNNVNDCVWHCPNGKTCQRSDTVILPGEYKVIEEEGVVCFCHDWHPLAFCGHTQHWGKIEDALYEDRCMKIPAPIENWS